MGGGEVAALAGHGSPGSRRIGARQRAGSGFRTARSSASTRAECMPSSCTWASTPSEACARSRHFEVSRRVWCQQRQGGGHSAFASTCQAPCLKQVSATVKRDRRRACAAQLATRGDIGTPCGSCAACEKHISNWESALGPGRARPPSPQPWRTTGRSYRARSRGPCGVKRARRRDQGAFFFGWARPLQCTLLAHLLRRAAPRQAPVAQVMHEAPFCEQTPRR